MKFLIIFFIACIFFSSSEEEPTTSSAPSYTSSTSSTSSFSHCGSPNITDIIVSLQSSPSRTFVFNAPFDINYVTFFKLKHPEFRRVAYRVDVEQSEKSGIRIPKMKGMLKVDEETGTVPIEYVPFFYDKENFLNDSITVEWVNIPEDASPDSSEECFNIWFDEEISPENLTLKIVYNP